MSYSSIVPCIYSCCKRSSKVNDFITCGTFTVYTTSNWVASASRDYAYMDSHNDAI